MTVDDIREEYKKEKQTTNKFITQLYDYAEWLERQLTESREENTNKSCCGNCKTYINLGCATRDSNSSCKVWKSDSLTRKEREV